MLRAIGDLEPHTGEAMLNGSRQSATPAPQWRKQVGLLPAESHWWSERVGDHFANPVDELLKKLDLPLECLEWSIQRISSGERQRLALARLLNNRPKALLLDEPTANLDRENTRRVEQLIREYRDGTEAPVLWVSHDQEQRRRIADHGWLIRDGRLEAEQWN